MIGGAKVFRARSRIRSSQFENKGMKELTIIILLTDMCPTTLAQFDWMFCLVRTNNDGKPRRYFLLIDMKTEGIDVKPIITLDGGHEVNEVFLEDVSSVENLVGEENMGWTIAILTGNERTGILVARSKSIRT